MLAIFERLDIQTLLCSHSAICVLVKKELSITQLNHLCQNDLPDNVVPVFSAVSTVHFKDMAIK